MRLEETAVELGASVGLFTVKVLEAVLVPSVAETVCPPEDEDGTIKEEENPPALLLVIEDGVVVITVPSYRIVIAVFARKFVPVTVTEVPTGPEVGLRDIAAVTAVFLYTAINSVFVEIVMLLGSTVEPVSSQ